MKRLVQFWRHVEETVVVHMTARSLLSSSVEHKHASHNRQRPVSVPSTTALCAHWKQSTAVRRGPNTLRHQFIIWGSSNPRSKAPQATGIRFIVQKLLHIG